MKTNKEDYRLFDNHFLEFISRSNALAVISIYYAVSAIILIGGFMRIEGAILSEVLLFLTGFFLFTLTEYLVHRYVYHSLKLKNAGSWLYKVHEIHHNQPKDEKRLTLPLIIAVVAGAMLYFIFWLIMGTSALFFFPGFLAGYASYLFVHFLIHTGNLKNRVFIYLWKHHSVHHFKDDTRAYGVSSPLWDLVFGTMPTREQLNF